MGLDANLVRGSTNLLVLSILEKEGQIYGYQIAKLIQEISEGVLKFKEGTLYPALHKLEEDGLISSDWLEHNKRKRRYYKITTKGMEVLKKKKQEWNAYSESIRKVLNYV